MESCRYSVVLVVPFLNHSHIYELIESFKYNNGNKVLCVLVNQSSVSLSNISNKHGVVFEEINTQKIYSSSKARNIGIEYLSRQEISYDFIMFPDDDSFFDVSFFETLKSEKFDLGRNYLIRVVDPTDVSVQVKMPSKEFADKRDSNFVLAINMLIAKANFEFVGGFDEDLGIGAKYHSTEDYNLFLEVNKNSDFYYYNDAHVYHLLGFAKKNLLSYKETKSKFLSYSVGYIYVLMKHKMYRKALFSSMKAFGAIFYYLFIKRSIKLASINFILFFYRLGLFFKFLIKARK